MDEILKKIINIENSAKEIYNNALLSKKQIIARPADFVTPGMIIARVKETDAVVHFIMVPPGISGKVLDAVPDGEYTITDTICKVETENGVKELAMLQEWPVRVQRPYKKRFGLTQPLITGQRVIDTLFPVAKGGATALPGGFGTGKTMTQHQLAKWSDADIIVYIGCGERGNEITEVLEDFPKLMDPRTNQPLMNRTVLVANTSNMPVAAREVRHVCLPGFPRFTRGREWLKT